MNNIDTKTILLVEDEAIISIVITKTVKRFGYNVITASSGEQAVELAASGMVIDLILMDIELGSGMDGTVAAQRILEIRNIPIVFHTSHSEREMVERVRGITRYGYVIKSSGDFVLQSSIEMAFELSEAHKKMKSSEEHFYGLFEKAPLGYQSLDEDGHFLEVNQTWLDTLGYSREEITGKWFGDFLAPEFVEAFRDRFPMFKAAGKIHSEFQMMHKNGNRRYIAFEGRISNKDDGSFQQTHCILSDITERKIAEAALAVSESRLIEAQKIARIGNWEFDISTGKIWASDIAFECYGLIPSENNDMNIEEVEACVPDRERVHNELLELINNNKPYNIEINVHPANGSSPRIMHSMAYCKRDEKGNPLSVVGVIQDITEQKRSQEALRRAEEMVTKSMDNLIEGFQILGFDWRFLYINDSAAAQGRKTKEEFLGHKIMDVLPGIENTEMFATLKRVMEERIPQHMENEFTYNDGTKGWFDLRIQPADEGLFLLSMDITERKLAEEAIKVKNEELGALNEELNSSIEEMETSIEEMETINEELIGANQTLYEKEHELELSLEQFRSLAESSSDYIMVYDKEKRHIYANEATLRVSGKTREEFTGKTHRELGNDPELSELWENKIQKVFDTGESQSAVFGWEGVDGRVTLDWRVTPIFSKDWKVESVLGVSRDISAIKQAEEKLRISEELYSMALTAVDDGIWDWNTSDGTAFFSSQYYKMLGYNDREFPAIYNTWRTLVHPDDIDRVEHDLKSSVDSGKKFNIDLRMKMKSGDWLWVCTRGKAVEWDTEGKALRMVGTLSDVTLRKNAEFELRNNQGKLERVIENSSELICEIDENGIYTFVSKRYEDILGYSPSELLGKASAEKIHPDELEDAFAKYEPLKLTGGMFTGEWRFMHKNGNYRTFDCRGSVYIGQDGLSRAVIISHDITESKQIEDTQLFLIVSGSPLSGGRDFFQSLAKYLAETLEMDYVCIDRLVGEGLSARTVAVYNNGEFEDNVEYTLRDTPCGDVAGKTICVFKENICGLFPEDKVLQDMNAESYAGVTLWSSSGEAIGLIAVISRKKLENTHLAESILKMVAIRAAGELERRDAEEKIKSLLKEKELILQEVHHRIKNNMNTINGLLALQADAVDDPSAVNALNDARSRVQSMMVLYDKLYRSDDVNSVSVKEYLPSLINEIVNNFQNSGIVKIENHIENFFLDAKTLVPLGIILNELITNIMKYAFKGRESGVIKTSASVKDNRAVLIIKDNGIGIPESVTFENSTGFGMQLVGMLTEQIGGSIRIERGDGTKFVIEFGV